MRWSDLDAGEEMRELLAGRRLPGVDAPPNLGVVVGGDRDGVISKHTLYRANKRVLRTASRGRLQRALLRALAEFATGPELGVVRLTATTLLDADGNAVLLDRRLAWLVDEVGPRLARAGLSVVDTGTVVFDPATGSVDPRPAAAWQHLVEAVTDDGSRPDRLEAPATTGPSPVTRLVVAAMPSVVGRSGSAAVALSAIEPPGPIGSAVADYVRAMSQVDVVVAEGGAEEVEAALLGSGG